MSLDFLMGGLDVATSGLLAERKRMSVITENITKSQVTRISREVKKDEKGNPVIDSTTGKPVMISLPYVRKTVAFREDLEEAMGGVKVEGPLEDYAGEFPVVHNPGHRDADPQTGEVKYSNVNLVYEMLDLMIARRSYEANLATFRTWRNIAQKSIDLMRS